jgi:hypothetical protein
MSWIWLLGEGVKRLRRVRPVYRALSREARVSAIAEAFKAAISAFVDECYAAYFHQLESRGIDLHRIKEGTVPADVLMVLSAVVRPPNQ